MTDHVIELSLRYSECIARAERAEAEIRELRAALLTYVENDEFVYGVGHTDRSVAGRAALRDATAVGCGRCYTCLDDPSRGIRNPTMSQMVVCPTCGNKRCPKATHHDLTCTNSNEPGQSGSRYA